MNVLVPSLLFGKNTHEFYLTKLLADMAQSKYVAFFTAVLSAPANTQKRFFAHLLLLILVVRCANGSSAVVATVIKVCEQLGRACLRDCALGHEIQVAANINLLAYFELANALESCQA